MPIILAAPYSLPSFESVITADSPVFWYRLGESSGTTAVAEVGTNGTYVNTPTLGETGLILNDPSTAVRFTAAQSERVSIPNTQYISNLANFSIEAYIKVNTDGAFRSIYSENAIPPLGKHFSLWVGSTATPAFGVQLYNGINYAVQSGAVGAVGESVHLVGTKHSVNGMKFYVNGSLVDTDPSTLSTVHPIGMVAIAAARNGSGTIYQHLDDTVSEIMGYNYELSQAQVTEHAQYLAP